MAVDTADSPADLAREDAAAEPDDGTLIALATVEPLHNGSPTSLAPAAVPCKRKGRGKGNHVTKDDRKRQRRAPPLLAERDGAAADTWPVKPASRQ